MNKSVSHSFPLSKDSVLVKSQYRPDIDGLRALSVLAVVIFHAFPEYLPGGFIGVDVFFVISGYLITTQIFESFRNNTFSFIDFYRRRILRIFPALAIVMLASLAFGYFVSLADDYNQLGKHVAGGAAFTINYLLIEEAGYFDISAELKPLLHLWSLAVEEQFYILCPIFLWVAWKVNIHLLFLIFSFLLISFSTNIYFSSSSPDASYFLSITRFWELLAGSALAWMQVFGCNTNYLSSCITLSFPAKLRIKILSGRRFSQFIANTTAFFGFFILSLSFFSINQSKPYPSTWALLPVFGAISIILAGPASLLNRICLTNRLMIFIGLISYPLYLWHWPILSYLNTISGAAPVSGQEKLLAIIASFILAWATLRFIETPIRSNSEEQAKKALRLSFLIVTIGVSGYLVSLSDFTGTHNARNTIFSSANHLNNRYSDRWFEGNDNWLFLGNRYQNTVSKLTLAIKPSDEQIQETLQKFSSVATVAERTETHVSLLIGPNKSTIYPEFLPVGLTPSPNRYVDMFIDKLNDVSNLTVHDPSLELKILKSSAGNLYHRTDTHWNSKGAYLAFSSLAGKLNVSVPFPKFETADSVEGDLIEISRLKNFPLMQDDNWSFSFQNEGLITKSESSGTFSNSSFGAIETVYNSEAVSDKIVWVLGDSFSVQLRPFINHTFAEVHYVGHWRERLKDLASDIEDAEEKPDLIIIVRVERSF